MKRLFTDFSIYIPTYRRVMRQKTWREMPDELKQHTELVCVADEADMLRKLGARVVVQPESITTISAKRQWIMEQCPTEYAVMLDDDLRICSRHPTQGLGTGKDGFMITAPPDERVRMFREIREQLNDYAHVGISMRMGNQSKLPQWHENKRMVYLLAYHVPTMLRWANFGDIAHREDMWVTLKLMQAGYPNSVSYDFGSDQTYGADGGESAAGRKIAASNADAQRLSDEFPGLVRLVEKQYKQSIPRTEVTVKWNQAVSDHLV